MVKWEYHILEIWYTVENKYLTGTMSAEEGQAFKELWLHPLSYKVYQINANQQGLYDHGPWEWSDGKFRGLELDGAGFREWLIKTFNDLGGEGWEMMDHPDLFGQDEREGSLHRLCYVFKRPINN